MHVRHGFDQRQAQAVALPLTVQIVVDLLLAQQQIGDAVAAVVSLRGGHAREWVVGPKGSDQAAGTADDPFKTISRGGEKALPGDVILVKAGAHIAFIRDGKICNR